MDQTDAELISAYKNGEAEALEMLVRRYARPIYLFVAWLVGKSADPEDIAQTAFINIWKNLEKFDPNRSFKSWAYAVARNAAIDELRKRKVLKFSDLDRADEEPFGERIASDEISAEERLIKEEDEDRLRTALESLSPDERAVITLHTEEDCTFEEIGEVLGKSPNTVKSQYRRALSKLRRILAPESGRAS